MYGFSLPAAICLCVCAVHCFVLEAWVKSNCKYLSGKENIGDNLMESYTYSNSFEAISISYIVKNN